MNKPDTSAPAEKSIFSGVGFPKPVLPEADKGEPASNSEKATLEAPKPAGGMSLFSNTQAITPKGLFDSVATSATPKPESSLFSPNKTEKENETSNDAKETEKKEPEKKVLFR